MDIAVSLPRDKSSIMGSKMQRENDVVSAINIHPENHRRVNDPLDVPEYAEQIMKHLRTLLLSLTVFAVASSAPAADKNGVTKLKGHHWSAHCKSPKSSKGGDPIQRVLNVKSPRDLKDTVAHLLSKASNKQLQEYKIHPHNTISLHAAWEEVKRSTTISRAQLSKVKMARTSN